MLSFSLLFFFLYSMQKEEQGKSMNGAELLCMYVNVSCCLMIMWLWRFMMEDKELIDGKTQSDKVKDEYFDYLVPEIDKELKTINFRQFLIPLHALIALLYIVLWFGMGIK